MEAALHGAQGRRPQPLHGRSRLESLALALECPGRTLLEPLPYTRFPFGRPTLCVQPTSPTKPASPFLRLAQLRKGVRQGVRACL